MTELKVRVGGARIKRQRPLVGDLCLRQLVGVLQLAGLLQRMTVLNPNGRIARISVESLSVELSGKLPMPHVSSAIAKSDDVRLPAPQTEAQPFQAPASVVPEGGCRSG